ncbi:MAG: histidine phosphatase family protein, partial [Acidimicrobiia bacterium]|nr:histidine phosphatase family protein [Acidimicrobiia bacterium]
MLLVRHGESEAAVAGESFALLDGQSDPALSPEGEAEAQLVCERLAS